MARTSRLYRKLVAAGCPTPIFSAILSSGEEFSDSLIRSATIRNGTDGPDEGMHPSTLEMPLSVPCPVRTNRTITFALTDAAARWIADRSLVGYKDVRTRFTGRIGRQSMDDSPRGQMATMTAASWTTQLKNARNTYSSYSGRALSSAITQMMQPLHLQPHFAVIAPDWGDKVHGAIEAGSFTDHFEKYVTSVGIAALQQRDGNVRVLHRETRKAAATAAISTQYPVTRSQVISPAKWVQPNEAVSENMVALYTDGAGNTIRYEANIGSPSSAPESILDWTHISFAGTQYKHIKTLEYRQQPANYSLPSISFDITALVTSDKEYHRAQAGFLLALNTGDAVTFSGDWPEPLRGVQFATAIDEAITPGGWTMTLSLTPYRHIVGELSPQIEPLTWESAISEWDDEPRNWNMEIA